MEDPPQDEAAARRDPDASLLIVGRSCRIARSGGRYTREAGVRGNPQGLSVCGGRHGDRDRLGDDRHSDAPRRCDDRRDHAARSRVADQHALSVPLGPRDQARGCRFLAGMTSIRSSAQPGTPHPAAAVGTSLRQIVDSPVGWTRPAARNRPRAISRACRHPGRRRSGIFPADRAQ